MARLVIILMAAWCFFLPSPSLAQDSSATAGGRAGASVIEPLRVVMLDELSFGTLAVNPQSGGAVTVYPDNRAASYTGSAYVVCSGAMECRSHPARFRIAGEANRSFLVEIPSSVLAIGRLTGATLQVSGLTMQSRNLPASDAMGLLDANGEDLIYIGGQLAVPAGTLSDTFRADLTINVSYN